MALITSETSGSSFIPTPGSESPIQTNPNAYYFVDWSKLSNLNDLIIILASVGFNFNPSHPAFNDIKHLLDLSNPAMPNLPQPEQKKLKLPKINKV